MWIIVVDEDGNELKRKRKNFGRKRKENRGARLNDFTFGRKELGRGVGATLHPYI